MQLQTRRKDAGIIYYMLKHRAESMHACHVHKPLPGGAAVGVKFSAVHKVVAQVQRLSRLRQPLLCSQGPNHLQQAAPHKHSCDTETQKAGVRHSYH